MKSTTTDCANLLNTSSRAFMVELVTLTLADNTVIRWSCADYAVTYGGNTWSIGPVIDRGGVKASIGISVDTVDVTLYAGNDVTIAGVPVLQAARRGALDGAWMKIEKGFTDDPVNPIKGLVHLFEGRIGGVEINSASVKFELRSFTELLDTMVPVEVVQATCLHTLYSAGCGVVKASNALNLTVGAGSTDTVLLCGAGGAGIYDLGELVFTSGVNAGVRRAVKAHTSGQLVLSFPLLDAPTVGDSFTVYKGCDKQKTTCASKFANLSRFKAFPFVPAPETAV